MRQIHRVFTFFYHLFNINALVENLLKLKNAVNLSKFSALNIFMHIFNMSVTHLQSI